MSVPIPTDEPRNYPKISGIGALKSPDGEWVDHDTLQEAQNIGPDHDWRVDPELGHHIWNLTVESDKIHFGPQPPILHEALMMTFPSRSETDAHNSWFFSRIEEKQYNDPLVWEITPSRSRVSEDEVEQDILFDIDHPSNPFRSKIHSQQYTVNGAMITYELQQYANDMVTGFARFPVPDELRTEIRNRLDGNGFEFFHDQRRTHSPEFGTPPEKYLNYYHPHFRAENPTHQQLIDFFTTAFEIVERGVEIEE